MKSVWVVAVVVCVVLSSAAFAQITPRHLGMGGAGIGVADDAAAWYQNPAGLAALKVPVLEGKKIGIDAVGTYADYDEADAWAIDVSGWDPAKRIGAGVGYSDIEEASSMFGFGVGVAIKNTALTVGANVMFVDNDLMGSSPASTTDDDPTWLNLGFLYKFEQPEKAPIRAGLVIADLADESDNGPFLDLGIAWPATDKLLVAVDVTDITDEVDVEINGGVEYIMGKNNEIALRAGLMDNGDDHDLTLGAGYSFPNGFRVDAAYLNADWDETWSVSVGKNF